jgi:streptomycin 6-kinase
MFTEIQINKIIENWGKDVYLKILDEIKIYSEKWKLSNMFFFESYSMNIIFFCTSEIYGECVLKIGGNFQDAEFIWEYNVLREYKGRRFVKVFESDIEIKTGKKIMLIERVSPGKMLQDEKSLDKRLAVFSELFNGMHIKPENTALYKKYADGINDCADSISRRTGCKDLYYQMMKAKDIYMSIAAVYNEEMLLHGDLHYHNILLRDNGKYAVIDPQGRIGDRIFDIPRYILIEYYNCSVDERIDSINHIIEYFESSLNIPNEILRQCFYIETAAFECWCASVGNYDINNVIFADTMMKRRRF